MQTFSALLFGDIYASRGREAFSHVLPLLREQYQPHLIVANTENLTHGKWPSAEHLSHLQSLGVSVATGGNHIFTHIDEIGAFISGDTPFQLRPANHHDSEYYAHPGKWYAIYQVSGVRVLVLNLLSGVFLRDDVQNPFLFAKKIVQDLAGSYDIAIIDFHRETTAELVCMAEWLKEDISCIYGTHTHVQTADERIVDGVAMITDIGMTGVVHSAIGQDFESRIMGFVAGTGQHGIRPTPSKSRECVVCGLFVEFDLETSQAIRIERIREYVTL